MNKKSQAVLIMYVPALHQCYMALFDKYKHKADVLYILDQTIIDQFPPMQREIRAIKPSVMKKLLSQSEIFPRVAVANEKILTSLAEKNEISIILTNELISDYLRDKYFSKHSVTQEPFFLRFDEKLVKKTRKEIEFAGQLSTKEFDQKIMAACLKEKERSADWFLRVGAAIITGDPLTHYTHNMRMPTPHAMWTLGDPRNYVPYGTDTHLRTVLHAEQAIIAWCARSGVKTDGASIYVTTFPCPDCVNNIAEAGIKRVYFFGGFSKLNSQDTLKAYGIEVVKVS